MRRVKPQPARNKIDLADPTQIRAWTKRLGIAPNDLKRMVGRVGNSIAAVSKEIELQKAPALLKPSLPVQIDPALPAVEAVMAEAQLAEQRAARQAGESGAP